MESRQLQNPPPQTTTPAKGGAAAEHGHRADESRHVVNKRITSAPVLVLACWMAQANEFGVLTSPKRL
jgi:hypothetical protein